MRAIVTDGVFSMDGDIAPLDELLKLAHKYDAFIFLDEAHATGVLGKTGRGTPELYNIEGQVDAISSTLGKALGGGTGGYTAGRKEVIELLRNKARPYIFSNTITPSTVLGSLEAFKMLNENNDLVKNLGSNTQLFRSSMKAAGFKINGNDNCPIAPVMIGDAKVAGQLANELLELDIYVIAFSYPVVPKDSARIRVQLSGAHTPEQINRTVEAFIKAGKKMKLI